MERNSSASCAYLLCTLISKYTERDNDLITSEGFITKNSHNIPRRAETDTVTGNDTATTHPKDSPGSNGAVTARKRAGKKSQLDLTDGPITPTLWKLATPLVFGFLINAVYSWTDMYFVSRLGDAAIAALGIGDQVHFVLFTLGSGFSIGTGIVIARRVGENRARQAGYVAAQGLTFMAVYSLLASAILYFLLPSLLPYIGLSGASLQLASIYIVTRLFGYAGALLTFQVSATVRSTGNTIFPMVVLIISALTNVVLDPILIFGLFGMPELGIKGAGIATATSQWISAIISIAVLYSGKLDLVMTSPTLRFNRDIIKRIFTVGLPVSLRTLAISSSSIIIFSVISVFGTAAAAAYAIAIKVDMLIVMPVFATGVAIETLVSQNIGAGRLDRVRIFPRVAARQLCYGMVVVGAFLALFPGLLAGIFSDNPDVITIFAEYLRIAVLGYFFFIIGQMGTRALSGAGRTMRATAIVSGVLFLVQIPLAWFLSRYAGMGVTGVFVGIAAGYLVYALISQRAIRGEEWMHKAI